MCFGAVDITMLDGEVDRLGRSCMGGATIAGHGESYIYMCSMHYETSTVTSLDTSTGVNCSARHVFCAYGQDHAPIHTRSYVFVVAPPPGTGRWHALAAISVVE